MTEPDEALLWAREQAKARMSFPNNPHRWTVARHAEVDAGKHDDELSDEAQAYRAGAAASEARIKALEGLLGHFLGLYCGSAFWDVEKEPEVIEARALLKDPDQ